MDKSSDGIIKLNNIHFYGTGDEKFRLIYISFETLNFVAKNVMRCLLTSICAAIFNKGNYIPLGSKDKITT